MSKSRTLEDLGDELCDFCPLEEQQKGVHCYGGEPVMCEGSCCTEAYESYIEEYNEEHNWKVKCINIFKKLFGYCWHCNSWLVYPKRRRMNTGYQNEESNFCCECTECYSRTEEYWEDMWDEYNSQRY